MATFYVDPLMECTCLNICQLIRRSRVCSDIYDFNARNKHYELVSNLNVGLKSLLHRGISEPGFYGDLVSDSNVFNLLLAYCLDGFNWIMFFTIRLFRESSSSLKN